MKNITRLAFLIVFILGVTALIVFQKSHSASADEPELLDKLCVNVGDQVSMQTARAICDVKAQEDMGCSAGFIRPPKSNEASDCTCACWLCFGVNCPDQ